MEACGDFLLPLVEAEVRGDHLRRSRDALRVASSELGDDAVALGAAALAHTETERLAGCAETGPPPSYAHLDSVSFGAAVVGGKEIATDLYIRADGELRRRKKKIARQRYGSSHILGPEELEKVTKGGPRTVIIGAGFSSMVHLTQEAEAYLRSLGVQWEVLPTPEAAEAFNRAPGRKALFMHVTC
jgi:hypothetical protein